MVRFNNKEEKVMGKKNKQGVGWFILIILGILVVIGLLLDPKITGIVIASVIGISCLIAWLIIGVLISIFVCWVLCGLDIGLIGGVFKDKPRD